ncbi:hypothetical protein ERJ75_000977100 [Trypanosoma vivax]|uniref:Uncharacterized protein n=1 Tax=Trypanosoma vivax (strain Y486) TaxID=1055687 RepID=G0U6R3_TRYVY|nr:hypothetical protein ERJ75_000977100 [Trypanosoma vivax]CCC51567.1 conserved hypothetical protein [Trypanosoma vivax Y486]
MSDAVVNVAGLHSLNSLEKGYQKYQEGLAWMRLGHYRQAIMSFAKASFFLVDKPHPFVASAECYLALCDFQGAVKQYRRSLWVLRSSMEKEEHNVPRAGGGQSFEPLEVHAAEVIADIPVNDSNMDDSASHERERLGSVGSAFAFSPPRISWQASRVDMEAEVVDERTVVESIRKRLAGILDALSIVLFNAKDYTQALRFSEESLDLFSHPKVMLHRCAYLIALERHDEAEKVLNNHLKGDDAFLVEYNALMAYLYCQRQSFRRSKALLDEVSMENPQHPQVIFSRYIWNSAYAAFRERAIKQGDVQGVNRCLRVFPEDPVLLFERAKHHMVAGVGQEAVPDLIRCVITSGSKHEGAVDMLSKALFQMEVDGDMKTNVSRIIQCYTTSLFWSPDNIPVLLARGICYTKLGNYEAALQDFVRILNVSPGNAEAARRIAFLHDIWGCEFHKRGKMEKAERQFSNAIVMCDTEALFYYHRARCRFDMDEPRYALRDVLSCQSLRPKDPVICNFINAHLTGCDLRPPGQRSDTFALPALPSSLHKRRGNARRAGRNMVHSRQPGMTCQMEGNAPAPRRECTLPAVPLEGVLTCRRARLVTPEEKTGAPFVNTWVAR